MKLLLSSLFTFLLLALTPNFANSTEWELLPAESYIKFSGTHAGAEFSGVFQSWKAEIVFDESDLEKSQAIVEVDLSSAETEDDTYDKTLPNSDWFNISEQLTAIYKTASFEKVAEGGESAYNIQGTLNIKGFEVPVILQSKIAIDEVGKGVFEGKTNLKRLDFGIGKKSDKGGEWVSLEIPLEIKVVAEKKSHLAEKME